MRLKNESMNTVRKVENKSLYEKPQNILMENLTHLTLHSKADKERVLMFSMFALNPKPKQKMPWIRESLLLHSKVVKVEENESGAGEVGSQQGCSIELFEGSLEKKSLKREKEKEKEKKKRGKRTTNTPHLTTKSRSR